MNTKTILDLFVTGMIYIAATFILLMFFNRSLRTSGYSRGYAQKIFHFNLARASYWAMIPASFAVCLALGIHIGAAFFISMMIVILAGM